MINVKNVCKVINKQTILDDVSIRIENGKCYGLVGRNGSGKTMLFRAICGYIQIDSGEIYVDDLKIGDNGKFIQNAGILIGQPEFLDDLTGYENLKVLAQIQNVISDADIEETLRKVNLYEERNKKYKKYSLGMKQRLRIAQAIMEKPSILILDEPFNGLDKSGVEDIRNLLKQYKSENKTIILSSHMEEDIKLLCDEIYEMDGGKIIE